MQWNFPVQSGTYEVRLFFAETPYAGGVSKAGARVFSVAIEGNTVLANYDIYAEAGMGASKKVFQIPVTDGNLDIDFVRVTGNPQVNGIEIISLSSSTSRVTMQTNVIAQNVETQMHAYPNPFTDKLNFTFDDEQDQAEIILLDAMGKKIVEEIQHHVTTVTLDLASSALPEGMYILVVKSGNSTFSQKVIKRN